MSNLLGVHAWCVEADLLSIVVPGALGRVAEDIVKHIGSVENIQLATPPVAVMSQAVLGHLQHALQAFDAQLEKCSRAMLRDWGGGTGKEGQGVGGRVKMGWAGRLRTEGESEVRSGVE